MTITSPTTSPVAETDRAAGDRIDRSGLAWALYEGGRNPYVVLCTIYVLAPYIATTVFTDPVAGQTAISGWNKNAGFIVALTAPFLGAIADRLGRRKPALGLVTALMAPAIFALWFALPPGQGGLPIWAIGALITGIGVLFAYNEVLHNSMLPSASTPRTLPHVSGLGLALGNLTSVVMLVIVLWGLAFPGRVDWPFVPDAPLFGLDATRHETSRIVAPVVAVWLLLLAAPLFLFSRDSRSTGEPLGRAVADGVGGLWASLKDLFAHHRNAATFLVARMLYSDGKIALLIFGGIYAAGVLKWGLLEMTAYGVILSVFAVAGGLLAGKLDVMLGPKASVQLEIGVTLACLLVMASQTPGTVFGMPIAEGRAVWDAPVFKTLPELVFLGGAIIIAISITAAYASSRTLLVKLAPKGKEGQFFGLYALSGAATAFLGPMIVEHFTATYQSQQIGFASISILLVAGFAVLLAVKPPPRDA
jgi:UMF1 family MFS transporter